MSVFNLDSACKFFGFWFFLHKGRTLPGATSPLSLNTQSISQIFFSPLLLILETQLYSETWNSEVKRPITSHPTCSAANRPLLHEKHEARRIQSAFPSAHPSLSTAMVLSSFHGSVPLWAKAQPGKTQLALPAAIKSKVVQSSYLIQLWFGLVFSPLLFQFYTNIPNATPGTAEQRT